jgi:aspartyl-tRNA(Asn)/glutamyl-tRNA(Gln) amidotransferase subunit A
MDLKKLTIKEAAGMLSNREVSAGELAAGYINRIKKTDGTIGAYVSLNENITADAAAVQKTIDEGKGGPLAGIPMAVKDNMCTEGIITSCASHILDDFNPPYTATAAVNLKNDGAILLGKMNLDEFAMGSSTENSHIQKTRNTWDTERVPGGSSGGRVDKAARSLLRSGRPQTHLWNSFTLRTGRIRIQPGSDRTHHKDS